MESLRRFIREALDKGGVLIAGLGCLYLYKQQYAPTFLGPLSYGMISVGALGFVRYFIMDYDSTGNADYQRLLIMLDQRKSEIEANREKLEELRAACESFMAMRRILEGWRRDPSLVQDKVTILEELLKSRDCGTSMLATQGSSTEGTVSGQPTGQWSSSPNQDDEIMAKLQEYEPQEEDSGKDLEIIYQKVSEEVLQDILEEISTEIIDKESEIVLEHISDDVQQEIHRRMQAELPEGAEWELSDKSMEEIMEKVEKELFEGVQEATEEAGDEGFELLQRDTPELVILEQSQEVPETLEMKKSITEVSQEDISGKVMEKIQPEKDSQNLLEKKSKSLKDGECQDIIQLRQENVGEEQKLQTVVKVEPQEIEHCQEQLEMEIAEALLEPVSEIKPN